MSQSHIPTKEIKQLFARSGNQCAFTGCTQRLIEPGGSKDNDATIAQIAHIVADSRQGPRGEVPIKDDERNRYPNLVLLCGVHHDLIDAQPYTYSVQVLRQMKVNHEDKVHRALFPDEVHSQIKYVPEKIHSSLLPVTHLPEAVFSAPCKYGDDQEDEVKKRIKYPDEKSDQLIRFLLRGGHLHSFHNLDDPKGPFSRVVDRKSIKPIRATEMWNDAEGHRRYIILLNRALYKFTARLGVRYDPIHYRYYFEADEEGKPRRVSYRPLNAKRTYRDVVWQPKRRATGEARDYWFHLGAGLKFHRMADDQWVLSIRPERRVTKDTVTSVESDEIGGRVTKRKARMWNDVYLSEINFWRDYLSGGTPRILLNFGDQSACIDSRFLSFDIEWPGVPGDEKLFTNQTYEEDLFTKAEFSNAISGGSIDWDEFDDDTEEDETEGL